MWVLWVYYFFVQWAARGIVMNFLYNLNRNQKQLKIENILCAFTAGSNKSFPFPFGLQLKTSQV